jgi:hypothetical protein
MFILQQFHKNSFDKRLSGKKQTSCAEADGAVRELLRIDSFESPRSLSFGVQRIGLQEQAKGKLNRLSRSGIQTVDYAYNTVEGSIWGIQGGTSKRRMSGSSGWPPSGFASADLKVSASLM